MSEKVLIIGGGIGGMSTAIAMQQRGINVEVVELNKTSKVYHVGIIVQSNFVRALAQLGVAKEAVAAGFAYRGWRWRHNDTGEEMGRSEGVSTADGFPSDLGLARPALHEVLHGRVTELGIKLRQGVTYTEMQDLGDKVAVAFTDGTDDVYDLVVGADGAYSKLREKLFGDQHKPEFTGQGVWRYNLPRPRDLDWADAYITDPNQSIGTVPLTDDTMYIFVTSSEPGNPRFAPGTLADEMRKRLIGKGRKAEEFAAHITDPDLVVYRPLEVCVLPKPWYKGRIVLIGDASHSSTPHLGQGAAMAVEDAVVLAEEFQGERPMEQRLARFMDRRFDRASFIASQSRQLGEWQMNPIPSADPPGLFDQVRRYIGEPI